MSRGQILDGRLLAVLLFAFFNIQIAHGDTINCVSNGSLTKTIPIMTVARDAAVGSVISTVSLGYITAYTCTRVVNDTNQDGETFGIRAYGVLYGQIDGRNVYRLGDASTGIGYAIYGSGNNGGGYVGDSSNELSIGSGTPMITPGNRSLYSVRITFYKIGPITNSTINTQYVAAIYDKSFGPNNVLLSEASPNYPIYTSGFGLASTGCDVGSTQISVPMGTVNRRVLGSSYGNTGGERFFQSR